MVNDQHPLRYSAAPRDELSAPVTRMFAGSEMFIQFETVFGYDADADSQWVGRMPRPLVFSHHSAFYHRSGDDRKGA